MSKKLFLIDGASGTGKSDLIKYISEYKVEVSYIEKYTTRKVRDNEKSDKKLDLIHINDDEFKKVNFDYIYNYGGNKYGFKKHDIIEGFKKYNNIFIIVRDIKTIITLKQDFNFINVISIFVYTDRDQIIDRLRNENNKQEDIDFRIKRLEIAYKSYLDNPTFYDQIIINSGSEDNYTRIISTVFDKYDNNIVDQNYIFVLMPFDERYNTILAEFKDAAKLVNQKIVIDRVDDQKGDFTISERIFQNIDKAGLIICDLTDERPNVYYELGYARGIKKKVILCAKKDTRLHFDVHGYKTIFYTNTTELRQKIAGEIKEHYSKIEI